MRRPVTYSIVDCPDGRFAVVAVSASGAAYRRDGFMTLADAESCAEGLSAIMAVCGTPLTRQDSRGPSTCPGFPSRPIWRSF